LKIKQQTARTAIVLARIICPIWKGANKWNLCIWSKRRSKSSSQRAKFSR